MIKLINRFLKILWLKSMCTFEEEQTKIPLKLCMEKTSCRWKKNTIEQLFLKKIGQLAWKKNYEIRPRFEIFLLKLTATRKSLRKPFTILISSLVLVMFFSHLFLDPKSTILEGKCSKETLKKNEGTEMKDILQMRSKIEKKYINLKKLTVSIDWVPNSLNTRYCTKLGQTDQINQHRPSQLQAEDERGINETFFWNFFISTDLKTENKAWIRKRSKSPQRHLSFYFSWW